MTPLVKWAGGKKRLSESIIAHTGREFNRYIEPFLGGGAMLFSYAPQRALCSDINKELVNFYNVIKDDVDKFIIEVESNYSQDKYSSDYFYQVRALDRDVKKFEKMTPVQRAARFLFLNKSCYNGLWRENLNGFNNVPWGKYKTIKLYDKDNLREVHNYLSQNDITIQWSDYSETAKQAVAGDFVYFDPPYDDERQIGFVYYNRQGFTHENQEELRNLCDELVDKGVRIAVSNADTKFIRALYDDERYHQFDNIVTHRCLGSKAEYRKKVNELLRFITKLLRYS